MVNLGRRRFIRNAVALAGVGTLLAGFGDLAFEEFLKGVGPPVATMQSSSASTSSENYLPDYAEFLDWLRTVAKPYAGRSLNISLEAEFTPYAIQRRDLDVLNATRINDQYSIKPYSLQLSDVTITVSTKSPTYDVFSVDNQNLGVFNPHLISPIEMAQSHPELTYPKLDLPDFRRFVWDYVATYPADVSLGSGGSSATDVFLLPLDMPVLVQFYRKDIYDNLGIALPNTWDEYFEDLRTIKNSGKAPFGAVSMAAPDIPIVYEFLSHLTSFGANLWEVDGNKLVPVMDSDKAVAALENFVRMEPYSDPTSYTYYWDDAFQSIAFGVAATGLLWVDYLNYFSDPRRTSFAGKVSLKENPAGPAGSFSTVASAGVGVSRYSKNPELAWLWLQWATARGTQETILLDQYHVLPTRKSPLDMPEVSAALRTDSYSAPRLAKSILDSGRATALIGFPKWYQALDPLSFHLNQAWLGLETPRKALTATRQRIEQLGSLTF